MGKKLEDMTFEELKKELDYWSKKIEEWKEEEEKNSFSIGAANIYRFEIIKEMRKFGVF